MEKSELQIIKKIIPTKCPECNKEIFVGFQAMVPSFTGVVTRKNMNEAKDEIKKRLNDIKFNKPEKKAEVMKWLDDENTLIDSSDIEDLLKQVLLENE